MLRCQYGASTLGKTFRRPIASTMSASDNDSEIPSLATGSMRSTKTIMAEARSIGNSASRLARHQLPPQAKTWHPLNGIIFQTSPRPGIARMTSAATASMEQDMMLHSNAEDKYVSPSAQMSSVEAAILKDIKEAEGLDTKPEVPALPYDPKWDVLPESDEEWKMTEELFRAAKDSNAGTPESYWSHSLYRGPVSEETKEAKKVTVHYCRSKETTQRVLERHFASSKVIGFDIEWLQNAGQNAGPKQRVSLVQVANEERVALFHLALYPGNKKEDLVSPALKKLMENPEITKVGVAIKGDCTRIRKTLDIHPRGLFELSHLFKLLKYSESQEFSKINKRLVSLATQVQEHLHLPMFKGGEVRSSDWSKALNLEQIRYAASDSYAGYQLYKTMESKREKLEPSPPRPYHAELDIPIRTARGEAVVEDVAELDVDSEEVKPEEAETPAPVKRKYKKKAVPYFSPESTESFDFEDRALGNALQEAHDAKISWLKAQKQRAKSLPLEKVEPGFIEEPEDPAQAQDDSSLLVAAEAPEDALPTPNNTTLLAAAEEEAYKTLALFTSTKIEVPYPPSLSTLQTYHLWEQNSELELKDVASIMRNPPLSTQALMRRILDVAFLLRSNGVDTNASRLKEVLEGWKRMGLSADAWVGLEGLNEA